MPIPKAEAAAVPIEKLTDYLLNPLHPVGGPKARWFISLGYSPRRPELLAADLLEVARSGQLLATEASRFGVKYTASGRVVAPSGKRVTVVSVWILEATAPGPRLVTAYPGKEPRDDRA